MSRVVYTAGMTVAGIIAACIPLIITGAGSFGKSSKVCRDAFLSVLPELQKHDPVASWSDSRRKGDGAGTNLFPTHAWAVAALAV